MAKGSGRDRVQGLTGADVLYGDSLATKRKGRVRGGGSDLLTGGPGNDRLIGGRKRDNCAGGPGRDHARGCGGWRKGVP